MINIILNEVSLNSAADMRAVLNALDNDKEFFTAYAGGDAVESTRAQIKGLLRLAEGLDLVLEDQTNPVKGSQSTATRRDNMDKDKQTYTIREWKDAGANNLYVYHGTLRGAKAMASRHQAYADSMLIIRHDGKKVAVRNHYGWYAPEDRTA